MAAAVMAGCGGSSAEPEPSATPDPTAIYSLAIDPSDGTVMVGAGDAGFYRVPRDGQPERIDASMSAQQGRSPVEDLVIRFTGPGTHAPAESAPIDIAVDPADPSHWAVSNKSGVFVSTNGGQSWRQRDTTFGARLVWPTAGALCGIGLDGTVRHSGDGGRTWEEKGTLGAGPKEVAAAPDGTLYAITGGGRIHRSTDAIEWSVVANLT